MTLALNGYTHKQELTMNHLVGTLVVTALMSIKALVASQSSGYRR
jgi:hypothetical protein